MQPATATLANLKIDGDRLRADFEALAQIGETSGGGINRLALSSEDLLARAWFADRVEDAGLRIRDDDAGNLSGLLLSSNANAKTLLVGSHLDSVPNGGRFDGSLGVCAALECLRTIREAGVALPVHLETIDFTDDEGCWRSLFGVRAMAGMLTPDDINDTRGDNAPFRAALTRAGIEPRQVFGARREPESFAGYVELHIEQGSRLERGGIDIGIVTGIVGRTTFEIKFHGQAGHSGTTDMYKRRDALRGAAQFITRAHDVTRERYGDGIFNCGNIDVQPGAFNVIPSRARLTVEVRHVNAAMLGEMETTLMRLARESAAAHLLTVDIERLGGMPAATMSETFIETVEAVCQKLGVSHTRLVSYAGHAAQITSQFMPSAMIFIPSVEGISHHPREFSKWEDVVNGANVLLHTILKLSCSASAG